MPGWTYFAHTGKCYKKDPVKRFWSDNVNACRVSHVPTSDMASIHDYETNQFIGSLTNEDIHIGGYYVSEQKVWKWTDGSAWDYTNWSNDHAGVSPFLQMVKEYEGYYKKGEWTTIKEISSTRWKRYWRSSVCQYD